MFNTIVTSDMGDKICEAFGVEVEKTLTGFKFIGDKIHAHNTGDKKKFVFGYEESYGCLIGDFVRDKDAVQASLMLCESAAYYRSLGKTLIDALNDLYAEHGYFLDQLDDFYFKGLDGSDKINALVSSLRNDPPAQSGAIKVAKLEDYASADMQALGFPKADVLKFIMEDGSWIACRPSGTEPKCKFYYCVCAPDKESAESKYKALKTAFEPQI